MTFITENITQTLIVMGLLALIVEVSVLGFSTFFLFFLGLSMLLTASLMGFDWLEPTWVNAVYACAILTLIFALVLWGPLKKIQSQQETKSVTSDFADISFTLTEDLNADSIYHYSYSGVQWKLQSHTPLEKGTLVKVVKKDVGVFWVESVR